MAFSIRSPDELVAVIPHMLGFQPEESLVFVPMRSELPVARVDLPTTSRDTELVWHSIRDGLTRYAHPGAAVGIVCFAADRQHAETLGREFAERLDTIGIDTHVLLWADETRWADLATGDMGLQTDAARERIAAMTVLSGRAQPAASREHLAESLVGDRDPVAKLLSETRAAASGNESMAERRWALARMTRFQNDGVRLDDKDATRLLVALEAIPTRDRLWLDMNRGNAASHVALWTDLTRRAPDDVRAAPASLLAFGSWLSGHGALAWCALDQVPRGTPYTLARLVAAAIETGMHPREWDAVKDAPAEDQIGRASDLRRSPPNLQGGNVRPAPGI
ncbi:DUF4192 domain-containing protein [Nocardioides marinus]|uniref:DUF4192 domain-containing protein n=1 Tax=Nocardioides marinus TaxID=374514 RepID=A0A7Y9YG54_9ACTN|nr:DUF4192 domain-containing protein [Nocardioides marinus]NYI09860.1 hypothetical protein [Nocardioides marinus]